MNYENASEASRRVVCALVLAAAPLGAVAMAAGSGAARLTRTLCFPSQLYEGAMAENQKLKTKLQEAQLELADIKSKLEKAAQVRKRTAPRLEKLSTGP